MITMQEEDVIKAGKVESGIRLQAVTHALSDLMIRLDVMYLDTKYTGKSSTQVYFITSFYRKIVRVQSQGVERRKIFVVILH